MTVASDLNAAARIRNAALEGFARDGVAATSIRDVARAAGVSPGLVQHHFTTKAALRRAVDLHVVALVEAGFADAAAEPESDDPLRDLGDRITAVVRDQPGALRYVARSAAEGDRPALELFDRLVALAEAQLAELVRRRRVRRDVDVAWAARHVVVMNLGTILLEEAVGRGLPAPLRDPAELERWNRATTELFRHGISR